MSNKSELINSFRSVRDTIKTFPFFYTAVLLFISPFETWLSLKWAELLGLFLFTSVPSVWLCWRLSKAVRLYPWHRAQCFIMLLPLAIPVIRIFCSGYVIPVWVAISALLMASLVNAYFVFVKPSVKNKYSRNNV